MRLLLKPSSEARVSPCLTTAGLLCDPVVPTHSGVSSACKLTQLRILLSLLPRHCATQLAMLSSDSRTTRRLSLVLLGSSAHRVAL